LIIQKAFPRIAISVSAARHFVADVVRGAPADLVDRAVLMVSEIATNAIQHAGTDFVVRVEQDDTDIYVAVVDSGGGIPTLRVARPRDSSGRGLRIVAELAGTWGVLPAACGSGKTVWFTLPLDGPETSD
jgi:anti-sigma regulatory factor (Ser/Thr protein kinase)